MTLLWSEDRTLENTRQQQRECSQGGTGHEGFEGLSYCCSHKAHKGCPLPGRSLLHNLHTRMPS